MEKLQEEGIAARGRYRISNGEFHKLNIKFPWMSLDAFCLLSLPF